MVIKIRETSGTRTKGTIQRPRTLPDLFHTCLKLPLSYLSYLSSSQKYEDRKYIHRRQSHEDATRNRNVYLACYNRYARGTFYRGIERDLLTRNELNLHWQHR